MRSILFSILTVACLDAGARSSRPADLLVYVSGRETPPNVVEHGARALVTRMYREIGVRIVWRDGEPKKGAVQTARVAVQIRYGRVPRGGHVLASAAPFGAGIRAVTIEYGRIRGVAGRLEREQAILAHVLAHELGHILQGTDWHAETGVMQANWRAADYETMQRGPLAFTAEDIRLIGRGLDSAGSKGE